MKNDVKMMQKGLLTVCITWN